MSTTISSSFYGSSSNKGFGGLVSGLDTDDLVKQMTARTRNKINRQYQSKQKLLYKQEAYREVSSKLLAFSNKYFSYSSGSTSNIMSSSFFKSNTVESSSKYVNVSGDADNIKNFSISDISSVATSASFSSNKIVSNQTVNSSAITASTSVLAGETMSLEFGGKTYNLTIDKDFGQGAGTVELSKVVEQLNTQLKTITGNDSNQLLKYKLDGTGKQVIFETGTANLTAASTKIIDTLNFKPGQSAISTADVTKSLTVLKEDILKNPDAYMTFDFNGVQKTINLKSDITDETKLQEYLKTELDKAYGSGKVSVNLESVMDEFGNDTGLKKLTFKANQNTDLFGVSSISKELSNFTGIEPSTYNRVNQNKAISETNLSTALVSGDIGDSKTGYAISVNGKEFKFEKTATLSDIMKEINSNVDAGVKIYYSTTTDTFAVKSTETGSNKGVEIKDLQGNLSASLFGTVGTAGTDDTIDTFLSKNLKSGETYKRVGDTNVYNISDSTGVIGTATFDDVSNNVEIKFNSRDTNVALGVGDTIDTLLPTKLKTGETYAQVGDTNVYNILDSTGIIGTATLDGTGQNVEIKFNSRDTTATVKDALINKGTDTTMSYTLNGVPTTVTRSTASFSIDGINIDLNEKAAGSIAIGTPATFTVTNNSKEVAEKVKQFITDYNEIISLINTKTSEKPNSEYQPLTPEQSDEMEETEIKDWTKEAKKGILFGDSKMNNVLYGLRSSMAGKTSVSGLVLADIGISVSSMDISGKLTFDEDKFKNQLAQNTDEIVALFSGTSTETNSISGLAVQIQSILKDNVGSYGATGILVDEAGMDNSISSNQNYISERLEEYDDKMADLKKYLEKEKQRYWNKFSALEKTMSNLNSQSSWLTDNMGS